MSEFSRRSFLKGAAAAAIGGLLGAANGVFMPVYADAAAPTDEEAIWGPAPQDVSSFDFSEVVDCDVVVVGGGHSGMPTAISAAQAGLKVVVLEKKSAGFGMRNYIGAVGTSTQKAAGVDIPVKEITQELLRYSSYRANADLIRLWAEKSGEAVDWYVNLMDEGGMNVWLETDLNANNDFKEYPTCHMFYSKEGVETSETKVMNDKMLEVGCDVRFSTPMVQLISEDGKVTGVVAQDENGSYIRVNAAKGVVLATGGYAANTDMMLALNEKDYKSNVMIFCDPGATGDGIRAAHHAGGQMDLAHTAMYFQRGCTMPGSVGGDVSTPGLWWMGSQPFLHVNQKGERFANESLPYDYDLHQAAGQGGHVFVSIFDANWQEDITAFHTVGCSRIVPAAMLSQGYEATKWTFEKVTAACFNPALEKGQLVQADTIEELAGKMGMDPAVLQATVDRYNELCEKGEDTDYYKESYRMRPVAQAPFYAVTVGGQLLCTMDGMEINTRFEVLDEKHNPIEGLYAVGNDSGRYFADCYPELVVGAAAGRSVTFGYLLGRQLAEV